MRVLIITYNLETVEFFLGGGGGGGVFFFTANCCDRRFIHQRKALGCGYFVTAMYLGCLEWLRFRIGRYNETVWKKHLDPVFPRIFLFIGVKLKVLIGLTGIM